MSFLFSILGCVSITFIGLLAMRGLSLNLGRGTYCGIFPFLGAFLGAYAGSTTVADKASMKPFLIFTSISLLLGFIGFIRDYKRLSLKTVFLLVFIALFIGFYMFYGSDASLLQYIGILLWTLTIIICLKLSSLVYEMPYVLISITSLAMFVYTINSSGNDKAVLGLSNTLIPVSVFCISLVISSFTFIFAGYFKEKLPNGSAVEYRLLPGSSGLFAAGFLLSCMLYDNSPKMAVLGLCIPAMVIVFPPTLICFMILTSYFGNKLHKPDSDLTKRTYSWSVKREKTIVFAGIVFLCLTLGWLVSVVEMPLIGIVADLLLLSIAIGSFIKMFMRKKPVLDEERKTVTILGSEINAITPKETIEEIDKFNKNHVFAHIITADSLALVRANEDSAFNNIMEKAELVVPDGAGLIWASDFVGQPLPCRVPGVALVSSICEHFAENKKKVYFIGSRPGIAEKAAEILKEKYNVNICGVQHGFFKAASADEDDIINNIAKAEPDVVFVALGVPRQEWFIDKLRSKDVKCVAIGVGGSFDVISGDLRRAPVIMQRCGIEWLFRLWLEPSRIWRMAKIPIFVLKVLREKWNNE